MQLFATAAPSISHDNTHCTDVTNDARENRGSPNSIHDNPHSKARSIV